MAYSFVKMASGHFETRLKITFPKTQGLNVGGDFLLFVR
jgi:hypothetical protein